MEGIVAALKAFDPRFSWNGKRGNAGDISMDAVSFYRGTMPPTNGSHDVSVIDVIGCHCGGRGEPEDDPVNCPNGAQASWNDVSSYGPGAWVESR